MQSLRALLLLVALSTTLFHFASVNAVDAPPEVKKIAADAPGTAKDAKKAVEGVGSDAANGVNDATGKGKQLGESVAGGAGTMVNDATQTKICVSGIGANCPASAISNLLSLAVVIVVGLFSRQ